MDEYTPLITEARTPQFESEHDEAWGVNGRSPAERNDLLRRLADALEAATDDRAEHDRMVAANAWERGKTAGESIQRRRWSDEPNALEPTNPYRITEENN